MFEFLSSLTFILSSVKTILLLGFLLRISFQKTFYIDFTLRNKTGAKSTKSLISDDHFVGIY